MGKKFNFDRKSFKYIKRNISDGRNKYIFGC